jgi:putative spermidine/putrescine transport system permease protein
MSAVRTGITPIAWLIAPSALLFALFFFLPMGLMAMISLLTGNPVVQPNVTFTGKYYQRILSDPYYFEVIWTTLRIGLLTTLAALLIGYPLAHWMAHIRGRTAYAILMMTVLTPMLTGIVVRTFAWMALLSYKGAINQTLTGLGLISKPLPLMYNEFSIVLGLTHIYVPYMVLTLVGVIGRIDERLEHAAQNLGASPLRAFLEVTLPLSLPGILAGSLLVFALAISAYVTPILMGGFQIMTLPMLIYQQISSSFNIGFAAALGMVLLAISLVLVIAYNRILGLVSGQRDLQ